LDSDSVQEIIAESDRLYVDRQNIANVSESVALLIRAEADSFAVAWRLSRAHFFLGQESHSPKAVKGFHEQYCRRAAHFGELFRCINARGLTGGPLLSCAQELLKQRISGKWICVPVRNLTASKHALPADVNAWPATGA